MHDPNQALPDWAPPPRPSRAPMTGRYVRLDPLSTAHAADLHRANAESDAIWEYLPYGPFPDAAAYRAWVETVAGRDDPLFFAIRNLETGRWCGVASCLRITPEAGTIEVGHINFAPALQRTRAATEAMSLMMARAFETGYRRYEWKCNARNLGSRRAAQRLGFSYEGVFRQAAVIKGRNRDTAWFAAIDAEWPRLRAAFEAWLDPANFDGAGRQRTPLSDLTAPILAARDPALQAGA
ncbi:GNAT family N-acetyltransferase [Palleronia sp. KMU-117]|uniref:GNAT family N-acetyltransferase n=1 Tax=Palleronia sp. KMU-117 TaxID=3434108 RepID=UPI003D717B62